MKKQYYCENCQFCNTSEKVIENNEIFHWCNWMDILVYPDEFACDCFVKSVLEE